MQARYVHRHVNFETEGQANSVTAGYGFDPLHVLHAVNHQGDLRATGSRARHRRDILLIPGWIANQQIPETLGGQVNGLRGRIAHDALKTRVGGENTPQDGHAAQRLGSQAHLLSLSAR